MKVVFFVRKIGPYHHARFSAAAKVLDLVVVQTRPASQEYAWDFVIGNNYAVESFPVHDPERGIRGELLHRTVQSIAEKHSPDVVVTTGWADPEYHAVVLAAAQRKINRVVISDSRYEGLVRRRWITEKIKSLVLHNFSSAIVAGTISRAYLVKLGFDPTAIFQPWDVVDNSYFERASVYPYPFHERPFLCIARFIEEKNIIRLIEGFSIYRKRGGNRKLILAGDGELRQQIRVKIDFEGIGHSVKLPGFVQYPELPVYFGQCLCLILPSVSDTWGLVVNEAMASGRPVLVSNQCGCAVDLVEDGKNGYTFDAYDVGQLADHLTAIDHMTEPEWATMGMASKLKIASTSPGAFAAALTDSCKFAMDQKPKRAFRLIHRMLSR